jgi:endonuclease-3 related protein
MPERAVATLHRTLLASLGPQGWWPADTAEEMVIGAVLTQAVAWRNAERALAALRAAGLLALAALAEADPAAVAPLIRPAGYFNAKARTLQALGRFVSAAGGLRALAARPAARVRRALLAVRGVGPETADAILCYALGHRALVADAYARRVLDRVGLLPPAAARTYEAARAHLFPRLPPGADAAWLGEFHALLVAVGKHWCRPRAPRCADCPARALCAFAGRGRAAPARTRGAGGRAGGQDAAHARAAAHTPGASD